MDKFQTNIKAEIKEQQAFISKYIACAKNGTNQNNVKVATNHQKPSKFHFLTADFHNPQYVQIIKVIGEASFTDYTGHSLTDLKAMKYFPEITSKYPHGSGS